jgi:dUTP pyrophosphatase
MAVKVYFKKFDEESIAYIPEYQTPDSSGMDLCSSSLEPIVLMPEDYKLIPTNLIIELPKGYEAQIRPRSGLALKYGITVLNSPGTVDADYRGEVKVLLINHSKSPFTVNLGDRIAQMIISKYEKADFIKASVLSDTHRGEGGYGSTGGTS